MIRKFFHLAAAATAITTSSLTLAQPVVLLDDVPGEFIDISTTGIPLSPTDDGTVDMVATIGNALFPPGLWRVGNNGGMALMPPPGAGLPPGPGAPVPLPNPLVFGGSTKAILPAWDNPGDLLGNVYWQEFPDMLIVQWDRNVNPGTTNTTSFQAMIPAGIPLRCGVYAQFVYRNVQQQPRPNFGAIFTIGYQDSEGGMQGSVTWQPRPITNQTVLSLSCQRPGCVADVDDGSGMGNPDGGITIEDLLFYLGIFDNGDPRADVDDGSGRGFPDGGVGIEDLLFFLLRFDQGC